MGQDILDLILIITLIMFTLRGLRNGLIEELSGIVSLVCGFWAARSFNTDVSPYLSFISDPGMRVFLAGAIIFFAVMIAVGILARFLKKLLSFTFASWLDKLGGLLFGFAKGILVWAIVFLVLNILAPNAQFVRDSRVYPYYESLIGHIQPWLPPEMDKYLSVEKRGLI